MPTTTTGGARWRTLYALLTATPTGSVLAYPAMGDALGLHPDRDRGAIQKALHRAAQHHLERDSRAVKPVPNEGYLVVHPQEQVELARKIQGRVTDVIDKGNATVTHVDVNGMTAQAQARLEIYRTNFGMQAEFNRRILDRQLMMEDAITVIVQRQDGMEFDKDELLERLEEQDERMRRLEGQLADASGDTAGTGPAPG